MYIAGSKTADDWRVMRRRLIDSDDSALWATAARDYFHERLRLRYIEPIECLQEHGTFRGEGFSIVAIQCTLIEFIESTIQGLNYRFSRLGVRVADYEYSSSKEMFVGFLTQRIPFSEQFTKAVAEDFYVGVRCGLLHEAQTKSGWSIEAESVDGAILGNAAKTVYRNNFQKALTRAIGRYEEQLCHDVVLQRGFIRKFDHLAIP